MRRLAVVPICALVGAAVGLAVVAVSELVQASMLDHVARARPALAAFAPLAGLVAAAVALRIVGFGASPATVEHYVDAAARGKAPDVVGAPGRVVASVATIGAGGALGIDGIALAGGGALGLDGCRLLRLDRLVPADDVVVAGAAAGIAALFQQPVFGMLLALELPYRRGLDLRRLVPAALGALGAFAVQRALDRGRLLIALPGAVHVDGKTIGAVALAGVIASVATRVLGLALGMVRTVTRALPSGVVPLAVVAVGAGGALAAVVALGRHLAGLPVTLGPGSLAVSWAMSADRQSADVVGVLVLLAAAVVLTVAGRGVGGLVTPLLAIGALSGRLAAAAVSDRVLVAAMVGGAAAALAVGYRVPWSATAWATAVLASFGGLALGIEAVAVGMVLGPGVHVAANQLIRPRRAARAARANGRPAPPTPKALERLRAFEP